MPRCGTRKYLVAMNIDLGEHFTGTPAQDELAADY